MAIPSITYKGSVPEFIEPTPRIVVEAYAPGCPVKLFTCKPATDPSKDFIKFASVFFIKSLLSTVWADPVNAAFLVTPYPVTTTSSISCASDLRTTRKLSFIATSCVCIPMYEICKVFAELGTFDKLKLPSTSVIVPRVVPFTNTEAPTTGCPSSSEITTPVTF